MEGGENEEGE